MLVLEFKIILTHKSSKKTLSLDTYLGWTGTVLGGVERKSRGRFYVFVDINRSTCRAVLIFVPLERTMFELHFTYLEHVHILSRKFFRES